MPGVFQTISLSDVNKMSVSVTDPKSLDQVLAKNQDVFKPGIRSLKGVKAKLYVESYAKPRFFKARSLPYALRSKVEQAL